MFCQTPARLGTRQEKQHAGGNVQNVRLLGCVTKQGKSDSALARSIRTHPTVWVKVHPLLDLGRHEEARLLVCRGDPRIYLGGAANLVINQ